MFEYKKIGYMENMPNEKNEQKNIINITIEQQFTKALSKLDLFSHAIVFTIDKEKIKSYIIRIKKIMDSKIIAYGSDIKGELIDIKPYMPCEDVIMDHLSSEKYSIGSVNKELGVYQYANEQGFIKFTKDFEIDKIKLGDYLKVFWCFSRFKDDKYRRTCEVNPPYKDAPKCGIFATRSPVRFNPIAQTIVQVNQVDKDKNLIKVIGFDGYPGTPIMQIDRYTSCDVRKVDYVAPWCENWEGHKSFEKEKDISIVEDMESLKEQGDLLNDVFVEELEVIMEDDIESNHDFISVENAHINNLKNISIDLPKNKITVISGVSGSGKSSLAFNTLYQESQKQFSQLSGELSDYVSIDTKVDKVTGLMPSVAIRQQNLGSNPRSTVGSVSKAAQYLKVIFSTIGKRTCPYCHNEINEDEVCEKCGRFFFKLTPSYFSYNNPEYMCKNCKGLGVTMAIDINKIVEDEEASLFNGACSLLGNLRKFKQNPNANWLRCSVLALADDLKEDLDKPFKDLSETFKQQFYYGTGEKCLSYSYESASGRQGVITRPVEGLKNAIQRLLESKGSNVKHHDNYMVKTICTECGGEKLNKEARLVTVGQTRFPIVCRMSIEYLKKWCHRTYAELDELEQRATLQSFRELVSTLNKIISVGLGYLTLDRAIPTLSGGEAQRLKIATQLGSGLSNILFIMDEPSKGLHPKDYECLITAIKRLREQDNTVILVEHKKSFIKIADFHIEIGPKAGKYGGNIVRASTIDANDFLVDRLDYRVNGDIAYQKYIEIKGAKANNLKNIDINIPIGKITSVIGVSGSGKSSLVMKVLYPALQNWLTGTNEYKENYGSIKVNSEFKELHLVTQRSLGKNSRSTPATYTGVFDLIRDLYQKQPLAKTKGFSKDYFSYNSAKGQCPSCKGNGEINLDMYYMTNVKVQCPKCHGKRYKDDILEVKYKEHSIADILNMEINDVIKVFEKHESIVRILTSLQKVGVGYLTLGQSAATLSGGEAQRIKLAKQLVTGNCSKAIYLLDEPSVGLHDDDSLKLMNLIKELVKEGATVVLIEHNPLIIDRSDYIIELGESGGEKGGNLIKYGWLSKQLVNNNCFDNNLEK